MLVEALLNNLGCRLRWEAEGPCVGGKQHGQPMAAHGLDPTLDATGGCA